MVLAREIINNEVRQFANYANERAIPSIIDGLKPSQRKVIACAIDEGKQLKVSQLGTKAAERYDYKHGEASIIGTAVGLAQNFPGSNNIPLLKPIGQFGNRLNNAASAPRYIYTQLAENFFDIFNKDDFPVMEYVEDEGTQLEPKHLLPSIPMVLVNGADGTGNGFKSYILQHNPKDVATAVLNSITGNAIKPLVPWVKGFTGKIVRDPVSNQISYTGTYEKTNSNTLTITDLPPKYDLGKYKDVLNTLVEKKIIRDYDNESNEDAWKFIVSVPRSFWDMNDEQIINTLKLVQRESQNFVVWNEKDELKTFSSPEEIIAYWSNVRVATVQKRIDLKVKELTDEIDWLKTKREFIIMWNSNSDVLVKLPKKDLKIKIVDLGTGKGNFNDENVERLLSLRITSLTIDEVKNLESEIAKLEKEKEFYTKTTPKELISKELTNFMTKY